MTTKKLLGLILALLMIPSVCMAYSYTITDTQSGLNSGTYGLDIIDLGLYSPGVEKYEAIFVAETNDVPNFNIDAFQMKLDTSAAGIILANATTGYILADGTITDDSFFNTLANAPNSYSLPNHANAQFIVDHYSGIYDPLGVGVPLDGTYYRWVFDFTLTTELVPQSLQVLFYNTRPNSNGKPRLSMDWTVPEPLPLEAISPKGAFSSTSDTLPSFR